MVYYKDNPNLEQELQVVTTVTGDKEYRKNCKYINERYYVINNTCFQIEGKWRRYDDKNVVFDWEKNTYVINKPESRLVYGVVKNKEGKLEKGYFSTNIYNNVQTVSNTFGECMAISSDILGDSWIEDMQHHYWWEKAGLSPMGIKEKKVIKNKENPAGRGYNIEDNHGDFIFKRKSYDEYNTHITPKIKYLSKYLGDLTFGFEFEVCEGNLPANLQNRCGVVPCRDGSLNGGMEFVTIPMNGAKGMQTIVNLCDDLKIRTNINLDCSLHIHFGNFGTDKLSIIALYRLCRNLQEELFTMFPFYKTNPEGIKQKNYTKKLNKLNIGVLIDQSKEAYEAYLLDSWNKLFTFHAEKQVTLETFDKRTREHPVKEKWRRNSRYYYFNFLNLFFTHRHTLEARLSSATTNKDKAINWFLICVAIIRYSQKYSKELISNDRTISLKEVLDVFPSIFKNDSRAHFVSKYLYNYFLERQEMCKRDVEKGDYKSMWDIANDKKYVYSYKDENLLE